MNEICRGYKLEYSPWYPIEATPDAALENGLDQRSFWNLIRFLGVSRDEVSAELRYTSNRETQAIKVQVVLRSGKRRSDPSVLDAIDRLLPLEYGWRLQDAATARQSIRVANDESPLGWHISQLLRRVDFIDLPVSFPWLFGATLGSAASETPASVVTDFQLIPPFYAERVLRRLPIPMVPLHKQLQASAVCVPLLAELQSFEVDHRRFLGELLCAAPCCVSITIHPLAAHQVENDRPVATLLRRCLAPFALSLAGADATRIQDVLRAYERYWLSSSHLCHLTIRVAARTEAASASVAHCLSTRLGGAHTFDVLPRQSEMESWDDMAEQSEDMSSADLPLNDADAWTGPLSGRLTAQSVTYDRSYAPFLLRMPHLYTLQEADRLLQLPYACEGGLPGVDTRLVSPFHGTSQTSIADSEDPEPDRIRLGQVVRSGRERPSIVAHESSTDTEARWHTMPLGDLSKHALIVGQPGSGKSYTTQFLLRELHRCRIPFLIIEPVKTEYYERLKIDIPDLVRVRLEPSPQGDFNEFLRFDPMRLQEGTTVARHVSYLKSCFEAAFPLTELFSLVLENGLHAYYTSEPSTGGCGLKPFTVGGAGAHRFNEEHGLVRPSFEHFRRFFMDHYLEKDVLAAKGVSLNRLQELFYEWRQAFQRRLNNLRSGPLGEAFSLADQAVLMARSTSKCDHVRRLLEKPTVLELDGITDSQQKSLAMAFILTFLFELRQAEDQQRRASQTADASAPLKHVLIIEEAHRLISASTAAEVYRGESVGQGAGGRAVSLFTDMLAEVRAYGQGIVVVEQIPTKIAPDAIKNTNLKMMLRLTSPEDREYLGQAMSFTESQQRFVGNLQTGEMVVFEEGVDQPLMLTLRSKT